MITRAYTPHTPTWQRFHEYAAPLLSSSGAGSAADAVATAGHHPYSRQYSHVYSARLAMLRGRCIDNAQQCLKDDEGIGDEEKGSVNVADKIIEVKEGVWSILVGTIVKEMDAKRRPAVESKYTDAADAQSFLFPKDGDEKKEQESLRSYLFDSEKGDVLHLEDESGRVELAAEVGTGADAMDVDDANTKSNALDPNKVATGVVAAVLGKICATKGIMHVHSIHFAGPPPSDNTSTNAELLRGPTNDGETTTDENEPILLLVSGLNCGSDSPTDTESGASLALRREMLLEYLTDPTLSNGASVCRVIVAGGGVSAPTIKEEESSKNTKKKNYNTIAKSQNIKNSKDNTAHTAFALRELDLYLSEFLASGLPVDYVPGMHDPTNANWPQRPLHSCLLPLSCGFVDLFGSGTNPYEGVLGDEKSGGLRVLGSDGLNIADLRRFLTNKDAGEDDGEGENKDDKVSSSSCIDALNATLNYGHMAPTGPDSLPTFPSSESDPFVLKSRPSVYFVGNCDEFETRLVDANGDKIADGSCDVSKDGNIVTRLVCVPSFALTGEVVLVKLKSLECEIVSFNDASL
eukprot:CAMPEP_0172323602 /NCGR_PEP_ID=MMETSP1058-20130122/49179_1 /TAXON_ID=83371 /ORGANISM="Detonula confervacea, Strain CCMP 353" /LENGTH=575 /DNA_ID=CAMNT_0013039655 /DNA_START=24 /DNA_END=1751 /DNA_ORIENTATION=-